MLNWLDLLALGWFQCLLSQEAPGQWKRWFAPEEGIPIPTLVRKWRYVAAPISPVLFNGPLPMCEQCLSALYFSPVLSWRLPLCHAWSNNHVLQGMQEFLKLSAFASGTLFLLLTLAPRSERYLLATLSDSFSPLVQSLASLSDSLASASCFTSLQTL